MPFSASAKNHACKPQLLKHQKRRCNNFYQRSHKADKSFFKNRPIFVIFGSNRHLARNSYVSCDRHFVFCRGVKKRQNRGFLVKKALIWRLFGKNGHFWPFLAPKRGKIWDFAAYQADKISGQNLRFCGLKLATSFSFRGKIWDFAAKSAYADFARFWLSKLRRLGGFGAKSQILLAPKI